MDYNQLQDNHADNDPSLLKRLRAALRQRDGTIPDVDEICRGVEIARQCIAECLERKPHPSSSHFQILLQSRRVYSPLALLVWAAEKSREGGFILDITRKNTIERHVKKQFPRAALIGAIARDKHVTCQRMEVDAVLLAELSAQAARYCRAIVPRTLAVAYREYDFDLRVHRWVRQLDLTDADVVGRAIARFAPIMGPKRPQGPHKLATYLGPEKLRAMVDHDLDEAACHWTAWSVAALYVLARKRGSRHPKLEKLLADVIDGLARRLAGTVREYEEKRSDLWALILTSLDAIDHPVRAYRFDRSWPTWVAGELAMLLARRAREEKRLSPMLPPIPAGYKGCAMRRENFAVHECWLHFLRLDMPREMGQTIWGTLQLRAMLDDVLTDELLSAVIRLAGAKRLSPQALAILRFRVLRCFRAIMEITGRDNPTGAVLRCLTVEEITLHITGQTSARGERRLRRTIVAALVAAEDFDSLLTWATICTVITLATENTLAAAWETLDSLRQVWVATGGRATGQLNPAFTAGRERLVETWFHAVPGRIERLRKLARKLKIGDLLPVAIYLRVVLRKSVAESLMIVRFHSLKVSNDFKTILKATA